MKKNQQAINALSDKAFAMSQTHNSENLKFQQDSDKHRFKYDQEYIGYKQQYDQLFSKAGFTDEEKKSIAANQARLRGNVLAQVPALPPSPTGEQPKQPVEVSMQILLADCKAVLQLPSVKAA